MTGRGAVMPDGVEVERGPAELPPADAAQNGEPSEDSSGDGPMTAGTAVKLR